jgi:steroid delta-isomerase-like uncharacterized protein
VNSANKAVVRRKFDKFLGTWDLAVLDDIIGEDIVVHDPIDPQPLRGRDAYRGAAEYYAKAFPHLRVTVHEQVAEGDSVVTRWTATARHDGELFGVPATGRDVRFTGMDLHRVHDGKIVEEYGQWDALGLLRQLGALSPRRADA